MGTDVIRHFDPSQVEQLSKIIGDTYGGLTGTEIYRNLLQCGIKDTDPGMTKWKRLYNALINEYNKKQSGNHILKFISVALDPVKFTRDVDRFNYLVKEVNIVLSFQGLRFGEDGRYYKVKKSSNLTDALTRSINLKEKIKERDLHEALINYCKAELLEDNYFHAVLEVTKGISDQIRIRANIDGDGSELVDKAFGGENPILIINSYSTKSEKSEQRGFINLLKGLFGTFRNPVAHELRSEWNMSEQDALDLFSIASYIYRRLDKTNMTNT